MEQASDEESCDTCEKLSAIPEGVCAGFPLPENLLDGTSTHIDEFLKRINACLNSGAGIAFVHATSPQGLGLFHQKVGERLSKLIPDNSCYTDNFEVNFSDEHHVIFRVKSVKRRPWSVFAFETKLSVDKGLVDPSQGQLRQILQQQFKQAAEAGRRDYRKSKPTKQRTLLFPDHEKRVVKIKETIINFQGPPSISEYAFSESVDVEAKSVTGSTVKQYLPSPTIPNVTSEIIAKQLYKFMWKDCSLDSYITALAKLESGGSVYFGVQEGKEFRPPKKWSSCGKNKVEGERWSLEVKSDNDRRDGPIIWKSSLEENETFLVARESDVQQEFNTGVFLYQEDLVLQGQVRRLLAQKIQTAAASLYWHEGIKPQHAVDVKFHPIERCHTDCCVVEIYVKHFPGYVFTKKGPVSYMLDGNKLQDISGKDCIEILCD